MRTNIFLICCFTASVGFLQVAVGTDAKTENPSSTTTPRFASTKLDPASSDKNEEAASLNLPNSLKLETKIETIIQKRDADKEVKGKDDKEDESEVIKHNKNINTEKDRLAISGNDVHQIEKRHFSSLLKFRNSPFYYQAFSPREDDFDVEDQREDGREIKKRFIGSILKSQNVPQTIITYPHKKHYSSLLRSQYYSPVYMKRLSEPLPSEDLSGDSVYLLSDIDNPISVDKRHIGSLGGIRYSFRRDFPYNKRFYASLLRGQNYVPNHNIQKKYFDEVRYSKGLPVYDSLPLDYGELVEYDVEDVDPQQSTPDKEYWTNKDDKRHYSSIIDKRHISSLMRSRNLQKRQINKSDYYNLSSNMNGNFSKNEKNAGEFQDNIIPKINMKFKRNIHPNEDLNNNESSSSLQVNQANNEPNSPLLLENKNNDDKRHVSSLIQNKEPVDKRHFSSLLPGKEPIDKRNYASLLQNKDSIDKRHYSSLLNKNEGKRFYASLLDNAESNYDKRHFSSLLPNKEPIDKRVYLESFINGPYDSYDKRHLSALLQNKDSLDKRHFSALLQNSEPMDKRNFASLLQNREPLDKRHFSALLQNKDPLDKRHFSSLLQNKDMEKRYYTFDDAVTDYDKRHFSSLIQNIDPLDKRHFSSLIQNKEPLDKRHFASLIQNKDAEKRSFDSYPDNEEDNFDKRHFSALLQNKVR